MAATGGAVGGALLGAVLAARAAFLHSLVPYDRTLWRRLHSPASVCLVMWTLPLPLTLTLTLTLTLPLALPVPLSVPLALPLIDLMNQSIDQVCLMTLAAGPYP